MNSLLDKFFRQRRLEKAIKYIPKNSIVYDIGCGKEFAFLKNIPGLIKKGIGLDEEVEDFEDDKLILKKMRIGKTLPLEDASCDIITMLAVLEHLSFPQEVFNECFRCLKKEGKLLLTTPAPLSKPILELLAKLSLIDKDEIRDHKNYFWFQDVKKMLLRSGFEKENIKNHFFEFFLNNFIIAKK